MMYRGVDIPEEKLRAFCRRWKIREFALFGSVLRDDFGPESDVDCLVDFAPEVDWTLLDVIRAEQEFGELLGRPVDLVERPAVEKSENWIRRRRILQSARTIYAG
ncbi:MAG: nucleotidyltransferase [Planctomycetes bacterium]|nr:nucleotidyltransferase [Planctomycetota bacterium]